MGNIRLKSGVTLGKKETKILRGLEETLYDLRRIKGYEKITFLISDGYRDYKKQFTMMLKIRRDIFNSNKEDTKKWATQTLDYMISRNNKDGSSIKPFHQESMVRLYGVDSVLRTILHDFEQQLAKNPTQLIDSLANDLYKRIASSSHGTYSSKDGRVPDPQSSMLKVAFKHCDYNAFDISWNDLLRQAKDKIIQIKDPETLEENIAKAMQRHSLIPHLHGAGTNKHYHIILKEY